MPFVIDDPTEIIKDSVISTSSTWSSDKIDSEITAGGGGGGVIIDDEEPSQTKVFSSARTQTLINGITDLNFRGPYNGGLSYAVNDVATYLGSSWLRINANGGNVGDTPSEGTFWTLLAGRGDQGEPGLSTSLFEYRIDRNATTLPGLALGDIRANNTDLTLATLLWVSHVDDTGNDVERFIALLQSGSQLILQDRSNNDHFAVYDVLAGLTQVNNSHVAIPVSYDSGGGLANLVNNHPVFLALQFTTNPSLQIAPTITGLPGTSAEVVNLGTGLQAMLQFTIPRGLTGTSGNAASISLGSVTTGLPGTSASITNVGSSAAAVFNFTIPRGDTGSSGAGTSSYYRWTRNAGSTTSGWFSDAHLIVGWDSQSNEITMRLVSAKTGVYAIVLSNNGGSFPNGSSMILSVTNKDYYFQSGVGQIDFIIASDNDNTVPLYKFRVLMTGSGGTNLIHGVVQKFTA